MNVYDFDETVFTGDSEDHFFAYLEKNRVSVWSTGNINAIIS